MKQIAILSFSLLLTSCAPKVITHMAKSYPVSTTANEVRLYGMGQAVPESAEVIGAVSVVNNGASAKCKYEQVQP